MPDRTEDEQLFAELRSVVTPDLTPDHIPGFAIKSELSRGGQGVVYIAVQRATRRQVALKVLRAGANATARDRRRFEREIELAAQLEHPGIVRVYEGGCHDGEQLHYAMELVEGATLDAYLRAHTLATRERLVLFRAIVDAVQFAHHHGVIHRDLKPHNIVVDRAGTPRILDFGAASALAAQDPCDARAGEFLGTVAYASPEQLAGGNASVDLRTDVYSLGVILYEMFAQRLPYGVCADGDALIAAVASCEPPPIAHVDAELNAIVRKALAKTATQRYATAQEFGRDLDRYLDREPVQALAAGGWYILRKKLAKHWRAVALVGATVLALGAAATMLVRQRWHELAARQTSEQLRVILDEALSAARPERMGGEVPLIDILDDVAKLAETRLGVAPDLQAEVELTIGDTYRRLMRTDEAIPHLRAALERMRRTGDALAIARGLCSLGLALADHDLDEAVPVLDEAVRLREHALGTDHVLTAEAQSSLALALICAFHASNRDRAQLLLDAALRTLRTVHGDQHPEVARARYHLAMLAEKRGDQVAAEAHYRAALATLAPHGSDEPLVLSVRHGLASLLQHVLRFDEAEAMLSGAIELTRKLYGADKVPDVMRVFARLHFARGDLKTSELVSRQALAEHLRGSAHKRADAAAQLEDLALGLLDDTRSEATWLPAFQLLRKIEGDGAFELSGWMNGVALLLRAQGRHDLARALLREALNIHCRLFGDDCPHRARTLQLLSAHEDDPASDRSTR